MDSSKIREKLIKINQFKKELLDECFVIENLDDREINYFWNTSDLSRYFQEEIWRKKAFRCLNNATWDMVQNIILYYAQIHARSFSTKIEFETEKQNDFIHDMEEQGLI